MRFLCSFSSPIGQNQCVGACVMPGCVFEGDREGRANGAIGERRDNQILVASWALLQTVIMDIVISLHEQSSEPGDCGADFWSLQFQVEFASEY